MNPDGSFGAVEPIARVRIRGVGRLGGPLLSLPANGTTVAAWDLGQSPSGDNDDVLARSKIQAAVKGPSGRFGPVQTLSRSPLPVSAYPVIGTVGTTTIVMWRNSAREDRYPHFPVRVGYSILNGGTRFPEPRYLPASGLTTISLVTAGKHAVAAWYAFNGSARLRLAIYTG
ncbi:MAG TPA: hypothetical protein VGN69_01855 [Solirubrobacteraceae bacterium]|nr:hypothetical protein [Solirubrobacteraceae bacterium]